MHKRVLAALFVIPFLAVAQSSAPERPKAGKVEIFKESNLKPGMKAVAWTVLAGTEPEPIPVEPAAKESLPGNCRNGRSGIARSVDSELCGTAAI